MHYLYISAVMWVSCADQFKFSKQPSAFVLPWTKGTKADAGESYHTSADSILPPIFPYLCMELRGWTFLLLLVCEAASTSQT